MKKLLPALVLSAVLGAPLVSASELEVKPVLRHYSELVHANYADTLNSAQAMQRAIQAFLAAPSPATQKAAQDAWRAAREFSARPRPSAFTAAPSTTSRDQKVASTPGPWMNPTWTAWWAIPTPD